MANVAYNNFKELLFLRTFTGATLKIILTSGHTPNKDTMAGYADVSADEIANGNGYTTGGKTLGSVVISQDDTDDEGVVDCADPAWTSATFAATGAVVYIDTETTPVADALTHYIDFGGTITATAGTFTVEIAAEGLLNLN